MGLHSGCFYRNILERKIIGIIIYRRHSLRLGSSLLICRLGGCSRSTLLVVTTTTQQLEIVGKNLGTITLYIILICPLTSAQTTLNIYLATLADIFIHHISQTPPQGDGMPLGKIGTLICLTVIYTLGCCQTYSGNLHARLGGTHLGVKAYITY